MSGAEAAKKGAAKQERKQNFFMKFSKLLEEFPKVIIASGDNVGSNQMQKIRIDLRGKATMVMGKKTIMRKVIRGLSAEGKQSPWESVLPHVKGNIAFVFCKGDLHEIKKLLEGNKVASAARAGTFAPNDVIVPAGNTGMEPTKTSFFQALSIPTKISKGQVEIINDVPLIRTGQKVGSSEASLLQMLNIKPFKYGLRLLTVYEDGAIYDAKVLEITPDDIVNKFRVGVQKIAALGLQIGYPTAASVPYSIIRGFKNVIAVGLQTNFSFPKLEEFKNASASASAAPAKAPAKEEAKKEAPKKEEKKEEPVEDVDMGLSLFD
jgi:large subunit ribosomal protein LP0